MIMKTNDIAVATSLLIQGFLRSNGEAALGTALAAIRREADDWGENLISVNRDRVDGDRNAIEFGQLTASGTAQDGGAVPRTPYNLVSVAIAALAEAIDLAGPDAVWSDFDTRKIDFLEAPAG